MAVHIYVHWDFMKRVAKTYNKEEEFELYKQSLLESPNEDDTIIEILGMHTEHLFDDNPRVHRFDSVNIFNKKQKKIKNTGFLSREDFLSYWQIIGEEESVRVNGSNLAQCPLSLIAQSMLYQEDPEKALTLTESMDHNKFFTFACEAFEDLGDFHHSRFRYGHVTLPDREVRIIEPQGIQSLWKGWSHGNTTYQLTDKDTKYHLIHPRTEVHLIT
tara:strand:- start:1083 stop:1730 length:648 start_codon:yes stop_codon:yes gene_type:complete